MDIKTDTRSVIPHHVMNLITLAQAVYYPELENAPINAEDKKINQLMKKELDSFEVEDIRLLIERKLYLSILLEKALNLLKEDIWVKGKFYEGDVCVAVCELFPTDIPQNQAVLWQQWIDQLTVFKQTTSYKEIKDTIIQRKITLCLKNHPKKS